MTGAGRRVLRPADRRRTSCSTRARGADRIGGGQGQRRAAPAQTAEGLGPHASRARNSRGRAHAGRPAGPAGRRAEAAAGQSGRRARPRCRPSPSGEPTRTLLLAELATGIDALIEAEPVERSAHRGAEAGSPAPRANSESTTRRRPTNRRHARRRRRRPIARRCWRARRWSTRATTSRCWASRATRPATDVQRRARAHRARAGAGGDRSELAGELGAKLDAMREVRGRGAARARRRSPAAALPGAPAGGRDRPVTPRARVLRLARVRRAVAARGRRRTRSCVAVVSQPDRPAGRGQRAGAAGGQGRRDGAGRARAAAREAAHAGGRRRRWRRSPPTCSSSSRTAASCRRRCSTCRACGPFNVHASLLPRLRGAAPIQWSIIRGDSETGVSIMRMEAGLDTGPVAATRALPIADDDTAGTLSARLADAGRGAAASRRCPRSRGGGVALAPQDDAAATLAPLLAKADGRLRFDAPARAVSAQARGVDPWPGATALLDGEPLKLFAPRVIDGAAGGAARRGAGPARRRAGDRVRGRRGRVRRAAAPRAAAHAGRGGARPATPSARGDVLGVTSTTAVFRPRAQLARAVLERVERGRRLRQPRAARRRWIARRRWRPRIAGWPPSWSTACCAGTGGWTARWRRWRRAGSTGWTRACASRCAWARTRSCSSIACRPTPRSTTPSRRASRRAGAASRGFANALLRRLVARRRAAAARRGRRSGRATWSPPSGMPAWLARAAAGRAAARRRDRVRRRSARGLRRSRCARTPVASRATSWPARLAAERPGATLAPSPIAPDALRRAALDAPAATAGLARGAVRDRRRRARRSSPSCAARRRASGSWTPARAAAARRAHLLALAGERARVDAIDVAADKLGVAAADARAAGAGGRDVAGRPI